VGSSSRSIANPVTGPAYLSGQTSWYSGGQTVALIVDSKYTGPLLVRGSELGGDGLLRITLADLPPTNLANIAAKESQHSVAVVSAVHTPERGLSCRQTLGLPLGGHGSG